MMFFKKVMAFVKFYIDLAVENKVVLFVTLFFPVVWLSYNALGNGRILVTTADAFLLQVVPMVGYIIVSSVLNGVAMATIMTRNSGFLKAYFFIAGSKWPPYLANLVVQYCLIVAEIIIFTIFAMLLFSYFSLLTFVYLLLMTMLVIVPIAMLFNFILLIPIRETTASILSTGILLGLLVLFTVRSENLLITNLLFLNPYNFVELTLSLIRKATPIALSTWLIVAIIYILVGKVCFDKFDLQNRGRKE